MAKSKGNAYDIGDILGVKDPAEEKTTASKAKPKKQATAKSAGYTPTPYKEKRDARLQAVIPKRLLDALKVEAANAGVSVNEVVNTLLENGLKKRG